MAESRLWLCAVHTQLRIRLTGSSAEELKSILKLPAITESPLYWWSNVGEKGQLIAKARFRIPSDLEEEVVEDEGLERYKTGMQLSFRREKNNRLAIQLPMAAFRLGVVPNVGETVAMYARPRSVEFWKAERWKEEEMKTAAILAAHFARSNEDPDGD